LDKGGAETVGGVVVVRYGENPLKVIQDVKTKIAEITPGLPQKTLADGTVSRVNVVPFYDRTRLIHETLGTLQSALFNEILVTVIVVIVMIVYLRSSLLVAGMLPLAVLMCFLAMKFFKVDANIVALSGIAIAIGTIVDMGIIVTENIFRHLQSAEDGSDRLEVILRATREVGGAVLTAVSTTIISFLPVFTLTGAEGKLFKPLAFTKTFVLLASLLAAVSLVPPLAHMLFKKKHGSRSKSWMFYGALIAAGVLLAAILDWKVGLVVALIGGYHLAARWLPSAAQKLLRRLSTGFVAGGVAVLLAKYWAPLGPETGPALNVIFVGLMIGSILGAFRLFQHFYDRILTWCLDHKAVFLSVPAAILLLGGMIWQGSDTVFGWLPGTLKESAPLHWVAQRFPGLGREFMPPLDEGSYLFMPTTMPHASIGEVLDILQKQDRSIQAIPEVESAVGKLGRARTALDPAPLSMIETLITYKPEYLPGNNGSLQRFRFKPDENDFFRSLEGGPLPAPDGKPYLVKGRFVRDKHNRLIPDPHGKPFRRWRPPLNPDLNPGRKAWPGIRRPDDIWDAIVTAAAIPGTTTAAKLQPISARMVMLQSGIRAGMGIRVTGPDLETIQQVSVRIEKYLRKVPVIDPRTVIADRVIGKPYLEIHVDRQVIAQYGIRLQQVLDVIEFAIGGKRITTTVEGRERYPVRVRYIRELRDDLESLGKVLVPAPDGTQIPLTQLADIIYVRGPQVIKAEDTFLAGYVLFDGRPGHAEVNVVEAARDYLKEKLDSGMLRLPAGVTYAFTGTYENQVRSTKRLMVIVPVALIIIFIILYLQFNSAATSALVFSGIAVAWSGGFIMIWLYGQPWFLNFSVLGTSMRDLFQVHPVNLSVAVWVGFLALFGIASDDGVVMATYLKNTFAGRRTATIAEIRQATVEASLRRVRPCLMTTATTILALIPVLTSQGRGSDIMVPMAIPSFGGMAFEVITMLIKRDYKI
jgi:Cu(I)/Ag(I) efflux system membrane protein CusA/SilA